MKRNKFTAISSIIILFSGIIFSCSEKVEPDYIPYLFRPTGLKLTQSITYVTDPTTATVMFDWARVDSAQSYTFEVRKDSSDYNSAIFREVTAASNCTIPAISRGITYFAHVRANAKDSTKNSKWTTEISFKP